MDENRPGYYAIIPANVRYDDRIPANAKLLYGEISSLIGKEGYCYASNQFFADTYGWSLATITRLITSLEDNGYISRQLIKDSTGKVVQRKLFLDVSVPEIQPPIKIDGTPHQNFLEGPIKNDGYTNLSNTNIEKENKKKKSKPAALSADELRDLWSGWIAREFGLAHSSTTCGRLLASVLAFYQPRETKKQNPARTATACSRLANLLMEYSGRSPAAMIQMLDRATASGWKSVYPPNGAVPNRTPESDGEEATRWL